MDYEAAPLEVDSWVRKEEVRHFGTLFQSIWINNGEPLFDFRSNYVPRDEVIPQAENSYRRVFVGAMNFILSQ